MTEIYTALISQIKATIQKSTKIKSDSIFAYPQSKISKYPAVVFYPVSIENSFQSVADNFRICRFKLWVIVGVQQEDLSDVFERILPNAVDDILEQFDSDWSVSPINGHRCWIKIDSGDWTLSNGKDGLEATVELNIEIKLTTTN